MKSKYLNELKTEVPYTDRLTNKKVIVWLSLMDKHKKSLTSLTELDKDRDFVRAKVFKTSIDVTFHPYDVI